jgi:hypothetical protein
LHLLLPAGLANDTLVLYTAAIDIWPDNRAVSPSLNIRRTFRPSKHRRTELKARNSAPSGLKCTSISERISP